MAYPDDNCVDVYTNDLGIVPEISEGRLNGFNLLAGGGMGMSHGSKETFPRLADPLCFVERDELLEIAKAIVLVQRDFGDRTSRKHARLKYLIHDRGLAWFRSEVERRFGKKMNPPHPISWNGFEDHLGWQEQGGGLWYYGVSIENGRIKDEGPLRLKSGLKALVERFRTPVYLTPTQDFLISNIESGHKQELEALLASYGIARPEFLSALHKNSMACPALPTCGLAITESERSLPAMVDQLEKVLKELGLEQERITLRMTGCPNGCSRPYTSEIGLVGRAVGTYNIYLGANLEGTRLNELYAENVPEAQAAAALTLVFKLYRSERRPGEAFGNFCRRLGMAKLRESLKGTI
jgi:sulfite reductase (ferredoxin)